MLQLINQNHNTDNTVEPIEPVTKKEEYEPTDSSGQPMFGLRAIKKTPSSATFTASQSARETTSLGKNLV